MCNRKLTNGYSTGTIFSTVTCQNQRKVLGAKCLPNQRRRAPGPRMFSQIHREVHLYKIWFDEYIAR